MEKTSLGIEENLEAALAYLVGWITGLIFYLIERDSQFVRFHAMQSILTFLPLWVIAWIIGWIPSIGWIISSLIWILSLVLWIILLIKAFRGEKFKLPVVGDMAEKYAQ
ncbi:MAG: DUF4870 domain-containing protein [Thermoplasmata archaeon]|nr:DUF4870 domain-containing protein [Thermoplasmata archaeon]